MAGLTIDDAMPRIIDAKTHGIIDYIHAGTNFLAAALFRKNRRARNAALALGAGVRANALEKKCSTRNAPIGTIPLSE